MISQLTLKEGLYKKQSNNTNHHIKTKSAVFSSNDLITGEGGVKQMY